MAVYRVGGLVTSKTAHLPAPNCGGCDVMTGVSSQSCDKDSSERYSWSQMRSEEDASLFTWAYVLMLRKSLIDKIIWVHWIYLVWCWNPVWKTLTIILTEAKLQKNTLRHVTVVQNICSRLWRWYVDCISMTIIAKPAVHICCVSLKALGAMA